MRLPLCIALLTLLSLFQPGRSGPPYRPAVCYGRQCSYKVDRLRSLFREHARSTERQLERIYRTLYDIEYKLDQLAYYYHGPSGDPPYPYKTKRDELEVGYDQEADEDREFGEE